MLLVCGRTTSEAIKRQANHREVSGDQRPPRRADFEQFINDSKDGNGAEHRAAHNNAIPGKQRPSLMIDTALQQIATPKSIYPTGVKLHLFLANIKKIREGSKWNF